MYSPQRKQKVSPRAASPQRRRTLSPPLPSSPKTPARRRMLNDGEYPPMASTTRRMAIGLGLSPPMSAGWAHKPSSASANLIKKKSSPKYRVNKKGEELPARALFADNVTRVKRTYKSPVRLPKVAGLRSPRRR